MSEIIGMDPKTPPHPVLNTFSFARVHADNQPLGDRSAFAKYYPMGLPAMYKMIHTPSCKGVAQAYLEDNLPAGFYTNPPPEAKAMFSTIRGEKPFRKMEHILPRRRIHLWSKDEVQSVCNSIRQSFWEEMRHMHKPSCWDDLWSYFDAFDLFHYGAMNLWNVINNLFDENKIIQMDVSRQNAAHIGHWADEWLKKDENQKKLMQWEGSQGPMFFILSDEDRHSMGTIQDDVIPLITRALKGRRDCLLQDSKQRRAAAPTDLMSACRSNNLENWLGKYCSLSYQVKHD